MKISVITTSYNYEQYIEEAINSVINQSYQNWELIIVDDGSSDKSVEIIKSYCEKDSRIKFLQHENAQNKGLKESILLGLKNVTGDWVAFLESDDVFEPDNFKRKVEIIKEYPNVKLVFNKVHFLWDEQRKKEHQKIFENTQKKLDKMQFPRNMFKDFYINNMILTFSCVMVEAQTLKKADFNTPVDTLLDWWLWIHLAFENCFYYTSAELTSWRVHSKSYVKTGKKPILYLVQVNAYRDIYEKSKKPLKLLIFIIYSNIKLFLIRLFRFLKRTITL